MRKIGYKDRGYYYKDIRDLRFSVEFQNKIDIQSLKEAFSNRNRKNNSDQSDN